MARRKSDIFALERAVKDAFARDKSSPEMYSTIKELATAILITKKMAFYWNEIDEISHALATEFYIKINHEGLVVEKWTKYIRLRLYKKRSEYLDETRGVEIQVDDIVEAEKFKSLIFGSKESYENSAKEFELDNVIESLPEIMSKIYDTYVRYEKGSERYNSVKISVMLSIEDKIYHNRDRIVLVGLDSNYESYVRFMVNLIYKRLSVYLKKLFGEELNHSSEMRELISTCWNVDDSD